jgi:hypothetical protein
LRRAPAIRGQRTGQGQRGPRVIRRATRRRGPVRPDQLGHTDTQRRHHGRHLVDPHRHRVGHHGGRSF